MKLADLPLGAIEGIDKGYQGKAPDVAPDTIELIVTNVVGFLTIAGGISFIIYTLLAGLTWITAREESERLSKAKQMFINALIGLAIVVASWAISGILQTIFGFDFLDVKGLIESITPGGGGGGGGGT